MCCNGYSKHVHASPASKETAAGGEHAYIDETSVATPIPDGYWINQFPFSTTAGVIPDLIGYGLGYEGKPATVKLLENPKNTGASGWKVTEIQRLEYPVGMVYADLTGNGYNDVIITDRYGPSMNDLWDANTNNGGRIQWLRNPGQRSDALPFWTASHIGNSTGMHRIEVGHFTRQDVWQVMGFPIIRASRDLTSPAPIILYTPQYGPSKADGPLSWDDQVIFPSEFRLIHDVKLVPGGNEGYHMIAVAGREGIVALWFNRGLEKWEHAIIGQGLPHDPTSENPYWGSGSVDICKAGVDSVGYIATCEGFHGNIVSVYLKNPGAPMGPESLKSGSFWRRHVIDDYGPLSADHTGTIHNVTTIGTGASTEPFGIACMGVPIGNPNNQGVYMYTPTDLSTGTFKKTTVTRESASRLAVAGFDHPNKKDVASITYYVPNYHTGPDPPNVRINVLNDFPPIIATKLDKEVLVRLPRPSVVPHGITPALSMISFAGKRLSLIVIPPHGSVQLSAGRDAVKVIYGSVKLTSKGVDFVRGIAPPAKVAESTGLSADGIVTANENGAIVLRVEVLEDKLQGPFRTMSEVAIANVFPNDTNVEPAVREMNFPFLKVDTLPWASSGLFNDFEFYNMTGFHLYFNDDSLEEICHMQAWTLGIGETARFHNHSDKSFCEIHYCLSNGGDNYGEKGGMRYFPDSYPQTPEAELHIQQNELEKTFVTSNSTLLEVPTMFEHGPLWMIQPGTKATPQLRPNDTVNYPWHAWLSSRFGDFPIPIVPPLPANEQAYDVWLAFEFPPSAFQY